VARYIFVILAVLPTSGQRMHWQGSDIPNRCIPLRNLARLPRGKSHGLYCVRRALLAGVRYPSRLFWLGGDSENTSRVVWERSNGTSNMTSETWRAGTQYHVWTILKDLAGVEQCDAQSNRSQRYPCSHYLKDHAGKSCDLNVPHGDAEIQQYFHLLTV